MIMFFIDKLIRQSKPIFVEVYLCVFFFIYGLKRTFETQCRCGGIFLDCTIFVNLFCFDFFITFFTSSSAGNWCRQLVCCGFDFYYRILHWGSLFKNVLLEKLVPTRGI